MLAHSCDSDVRVLTGIAIGRNTFKPYRNMILASLSCFDIERLEPYLSLVNLPRDLTLHAPGKAVNTIYFLEDGICSIVAMMANGAAVEVGLIGSEGFVGLPGELGIIHWPNRSFMQIPGHGYRVNSNILTEQSETSGTLRSCLMRGIHGLLVQTAQTAACNRLHKLSERMARWLLMCNARIHSDQIEITQDFLAIMLGTRRSTVSVAAGTLQQAGLITCMRGHIIIEDLVGLKEAACECYQVVHDVYIQLGLM